MPQLHQNEDATMKLYDSFEIMTIISLQIAMKTTVKITCHKSKAFEYHEPIYINHSDKLFSKDF